MPDLSPGAVALPPPPDELTAPDPLARVRNADGTVNWLAVGEAEQARRAGCATAEMIDVLDWLHANGGTFYVSRAAVEFHNHVSEVIRQNGGVIVSERIGYDSSGQQTVVRTIQRFPRRAFGTACVARHSRPRTRARGAGRPRAQAARSSAASGDSGDSDSDGGDGPSPAARPDLRLARSSSTRYAYGCLTPDERGEGT